ncbi:MAG: hypothetical protein RLT05_16290 [Bauldia litoralis]
MYGGTGDDYMKGDDGNDILSGGLGKNKMWGGDGDDAFLFDVTPVAGTKAIIKDFKPGTDELWLDSTIFSAVGGKVGKKEFYEGKNAKDGNDHFIYKGEKKLYWDVDAKGGADKVLIAKFEKGTSLDHHDFMVI